MTVKTLAARASGLSRGAGQAAIAVAIAAEQVGPEIMRFGQGLSKIGYALTDLSKRLQEIKDGSFDE